MAPYLNKETNDWDEQLPFAVFAYRQAMHSSTGHSPFYLLYGRDPMLPDDLMYQPKELPVCPEGYVEQTQQRLIVAWQTARQMAAARASEDKRRIDKKARPQALKIGDLVAVRKPHNTPGVAKKLSPRFNAPYRVVEVCWPNVRVVRVGDRPDKVYRYHMNSVKRYVIQPLKEGDEQKEEECRCGVCHKLYDAKEPNKRWIACDICDEWFHFPCVGVRKAPNQDQPWHCKVCRAGNEEGADRS